ncbi:MAG: hypothetical protein ACPGVZ_17285 [Myxococcota bacterium]
MSNHPFRIEPAELAGSAGDPRLGLLCAIEALTRDDFLESHVPGAGCLDPAVLSEPATRGPAPGSPD